MLLRTDTLPAELTFAFEMSANWFGGMRTSLGQTCVCRSSPGVRDGVVHVVAMISSGVLGDPGRRSSSTVCNGRLRDARVVEQAGCADVRLPMYTI